MCAAVLVRLLRSTGLLASLRNDAELDLPPLDIEYAPVYGWFTEGFETRDLKEAKALLDELR